MEMLNLEKELQSNSYPGRGIIIGDRIFYYGKK